MTAPHWVPDMHEDNYDHDGARGPHRPGRVSNLRSGHQCEPCEQGDGRSGYVAQHMRYRGRQRPGHAPHQLGSGGPGRLRSVAFIPNQRQRHGWLWEPKSRRWLHVEVAGGREVAPGHVVAFRGVEVPAHVLPRGWPRMHVTPPNYHVHHVPPGLVPVGERGGHAIGAPATHVPGHYGWSPVLHKHVWIGAHADAAAVNPAALPPAAREAFRTMAEASKKRATAYAHAHTYWGASGARTSIIPGHWQWDKAKHEWEYIEPHADSTGRPGVVRYAIAHAPPAAFGRRPSYLPPRMFWPDSGGYMRDVGNRTPTGASISIMVPPHARYAAANGLLSAPVISTVLAAQQSATAQGAQAAVANLMAQGMTRAQAVAKHNAAVALYRNPDVQAAREQRAEQRKAAQDLGLS